MICFLGSLVLLLKTLKEVNLAEKDEAKKRGKILQSSWLFMFCFRLRAGPTETRLVTDFERFFVAFEMQAGLPSLVRFCVKESLRVTLAQHNTKRRKNPSTYTTMMSLYALLSVALLASTASVAAGADNSVPELRSLRGEEEEVRPSACCLSSTSIAETTEPPCP